MAESSPKGYKRVGKGEIAYCEQFLLFPQCFQKTCTSDTFKPGLIRETVKATKFSMTLSIFQVFTKQQNFRLFQIESICRQQIKCDSKSEILF